jgi:hypothetical protein
MLALTGILLWTRLHGPRVMALGLVGGVFTLTLALAASAL